MSSGGLSPINRALNVVPKRAEARQAEQLRDTFVDSGVAAALEAIDHQVLYGRRGTGKTHAFRYLQSVVQEQGDVSFYADLRTIGSPEGLFAGDQIETAERAARLLVDLMSQLHDAILTAALNDEVLIEEPFVRKIDALAAAITTVRVAGDVEVVDEGEATDSTGASASVGGSLSADGPRLEGKVGADERSTDRALRRATRRGTERISLNFSEIAKALRELTDSLATRRIWLLLDEWSSVPTDVQPLLGEFLVRCVLPLQDRITVKIAAIEQQTNFREQLESGDMIGIELGADVAANLDLDEFMVFEQNQERARSFFRGLLFKHITADSEDSGEADGLNLASESEFIREGFTDRRALDELVRAAEGVPRDAINIAAKAALRAGAGKISVPDVRAAARTWFQADKEAALRGREDALALLNWIIDRVIREKRARGFLVNQKSAQAPLLLAMFDARVLHVVRKGYSAQDEPGERYDVYVIDFGAYVDLIHTQNEPQGTLLAEGDGGDGAYVEVPTQDLRAIRRSILDLDDFSAAHAATTKETQA